MAYAYGTNAGIGAVAQGDHGHSESDIRYVARRYFTLEGARAVAVELANATFAARQSGIWGESTTTVALSCRETSLSVLGEEALQGGLGAVHVSRLVKPVVRATPGLGSILVGKVARP